MDLYLAHHGRDGFVLDAAELSGRNLTVLSSVERLVLAPTIDLSRNLLVSLDWSARSYLG